MNRDTASQQIRASADPFGYERSRTQITQFGVASGGYLGHPDRLADAFQPEDPLVYGGQVLHAV